MRPIPLPLLKKGERYWFTKSTLSEPEIPHKSIIHVSKNMPIEIGDITTFFNAHKFGLRMQFAEIENFIHDRGLKIGQLRFFGAGFSGDNKRFISVTDLKECPAVIGVYPSNKYTTKQITGLLETDLNDEYIIPSQLEGADHGV